MSLFQLFTKLLQSTVIPEFQEIFSQMEQSLGPCSVYRLRLGLDSGGHYSGNGGIRERYRAIEVESSSCANNGRFAAGRPHE